MMKNSTKRTIVAIAAVLIGSIQASAATVESVSGSVFVNRGKGFVAATGGTQVKTGDVVMVRDGGEALVVYTDGCQARVKPAESITVTEASPCSLAKEANLTPGLPAPGTLLIGAAVVGGTIAGAIALSNNDSKSSPASP
jgi:hypothetical protein